jgi:BMFP domain-containing protein YqiC
MPFKSTSGASPRRVRRRVGPCYSGLQPSTERLARQIMSSPASRIFDDLGRLMTDAAGVASGVRREIDSVVKSQIERLLRDADVVTREEFEAVREMAVLAREENEALKQRIAALEAAGAKKAKV